jgi:hypothetical protein
VTGSSTTRHDARTLDRDMILAERELGRCAKVIRLCDTGNEIRLETQEALT